MTGIFFCKILSSEPAESSSSAISWAWWAVRRNIIYIAYKFITTNVWLSIIRNLFSSKAPLIYYLGSTKRTATTIQANKRPQQQKQQPHIDCVL